MLNKRSETRAWTRRRSRRLAPQSPRRAAAVARRPAAAGALVAVAVLACGGAATAGPWTFTEVTDAAGLTFRHGFVGDPQAESPMISGGVAAGDYDGDGWTDLYFVGGDAGRNRLFRNLGDGTFAERAIEAGVALPGTMGAGPLFADLDGDGWLDLVVGGVIGTQIRVFRNLGDGRFRDFTQRTGIASASETFGASAADYDRDGDLDLFLTHWVWTLEPRYLWRNEGDGTFVDVTDAAGVGEASYNSFTANFVDTDADGWLDIVVAADFHTSQTFRSNGDGTFTNTTNVVIDDENGMGAAIGDYDNDLDLDWFVTSIWDPNGYPEGNWGVSGNRLYRNTGVAELPFEDATDAAGVRVGGWGWGACFADFNNDGWLDLFHTNGMNFLSSYEFHHDPSRLFVNRGDGTFRERSHELGLHDNGQGRGVVCFDYDRDGDLDVLVANNSQAPRLYRNDGGNTFHWLRVALRGPRGNTQGIGARIYTSAGPTAQVRELRAGSNYASQNPPIAHFGLGYRGGVDRVRVEWPDGTRTVLRDVPADQLLVVEHPDALP